LCVQITDTLIHRLCTTLKIVKMYIQQQSVSALQQQAIIRSSYTDSDQSGGQDLVLLQSILKITIYFTTQLYANGMLLIYSVMCDLSGCTIFSHIRQHFRNNSD
jgi:hypothetical protein